MGYSNLMKFETEGNVLGVRVVVKKIPVGLELANYYRMQELVKEQEDKKRITVQMAQEIDLEKIFHCVKEWDLKDDAGQIVPITREELWKLFDEYQEFIYGVLTLITQHNKPLEEDKKK